MFRRWDAKYRAKRLPGLEPGDRVWVKAPTDRGREGTVLRADDNPDSVWVTVEGRDLRRNRKHLFTWRTECAKRGGEWSRYV